MSYLWNLYPKANKVIIIIIMVLYFARKFAMTIKIYLIKAA